MYIQNMYIQTHTNTYIKTHTNTCKQTATAQKIHTHRAHTNPGRKVTNTYENTPTITNRHQQPCNAHKHTHTLHTKMPMHKHIRNTEQCTEHTHNTHTQTQCKISADFGLKVKIDLSKCITYA